MFSLKGTLLYRKCSTVVFSIRKIILVFWAQVSFTPGTRDISDTRNMSPPVFLNCRFSPCHFIKALFIGVKKMLINNWLTCTGVLNSRCYIGIVRLTWCWGCSWDGYGLLLRGRRRINSNYNMTEVITQTQAALRGKQGLFIQFIQSWKWVVHLVWHKKKSFSSD